MKNKVMKAKVKTKARGSWGTDTPPPHFDVEN